MTSKKHRRPGTVLFPTHKRKASIRRRRRKQRVFLTPRY